MDRRQVMEALQAEITAANLGGSILDAVVQRFDVRLQILELQKQLGGKHPSAPNTESTPSGGSEAAADDLGSVIYNLLLDSGPLKFADIMKALGKRHPLLKGVKYPSARVQAAIKRETAIERVAVGVYAAVKDSVRR